MPPSEATRSDARIESSTVSRHGGSCRYPKSRPNNARFLSSDSLSSFGWKYFNLLAWLNRIGSRQHDRFVAVEA
jgi:hypothetical protein